MFTEANTVENYIIHLLTGRQPISEGPAMAKETRTGYGKIGWEYVYGPGLPRATNDVLIEDYLRQALIRLNPEIAARPDRADEVLYRLRAILLSVQAEGLVRANELLAEWLRGDKSMPFGPNHEYVPVKLIDFEDLARNDYILSNQVTYKAGQLEKRFDLVLFVNGLPLVVGEAKTPVRQAVTWFDGAHQVHHDYEETVPAFFVPNIFSFATEGKDYYFGAVRTPLEYWAVWRSGTNSSLSYGGLKSIEGPLRSMLRPAVILDILQNFTVWATDKRHRKIKLICRYQQYYTANQIVERVVEGRIKKGLIWHFQGSGKSLLMVFAAQKLRLHPALKNPTVLIVVDRIDLDTQITATFNAADVPNIAAADSREVLQTMLAQDVRKIIITTIHKFGEAEGVLNTRSNIILFADEAHRTQEGDLGDKMRAALPNAFFFGLTGTPINQRDRNTFRNFGAVEDENAYLSRYSFEESIRDGATLPLHFEARLINLRIDQAAIDEAFANLTGHLSEEDQANLSQRAAKLAVLVKAPERVQTIVEDIVQHYREKIEPNGFKAQIVAFDREACVIYKNFLDRLLDPEESAIVMTVNAGEDEWRQYRRNKDDEEKLLDRFRDPSDPLKFLIVTSKLLTGFDAPNLQAQYLDKPMKDHNLLQAICRTNRPYPNKSHGLIVDYLGIFDDVARALDFDEAAVRQVISNIDRLRVQFDAALAACLAFFPDVDRTVEGFEGLLAAQECLPDDDTRDAFAAEYSVLSRLWEAISPDPPFLGPYRADYRWLTQVYESVKPPSGHGRLLWHALGAKTLDLIHENIHVETVRDDLETLVLDADFLAELEAHQNPKQIKELEIKIIKRLQRHQDKPQFVQLGLRLENLKQQLAQGQLTSLEYLKKLLEIAREVVNAEKQVDPAEARKSAKAALTELFLETRTVKTPKMVERIVNDIDSIVRVVRFEGWQNTSAGEREVKKALRKTLMKYKLHTEHELFDQAYGYIREYY